jgi:hypothetical protein
MASAWKGTLYVRVAAGCAYHVRSDDQARTLKEATINRIA